MKYPKEFIEMVKEVYPHEDMLHIMLDNNCFEVGKFLDEKSRETENQLGEIILLASENSIEDLRQLTKEVTSRNEVYKYWAYLVQLDKLNREEEKSL